MKSNLSIKVNGREVEGRAKRAGVAVILGFLGVILLGLGLFIFAAACIVLIPVALVLAFVAGIIAVLSRKKI